MEKKIVTCFSFIWQSKCCHFLTRTFTKLKKKVVKITTTKKLNKRSTPSSGMTNPEMKSFLSIAIAKSRTNSELSTSSEDTVSSKITNQTDETERLEAGHRGWVEIHGFRGNEYWDAPLRVKIDRGENSRHDSKFSRNLSYEDE